MSFHFSKDGERVTPQGPSDSLKSKKQRLPHVPCDVPGALAAGSRQGSEAPMGPTQAIGGFPASKFGILVVLYEVHLGCFYYCMAWMNVVGCVSLWVRMPISVSLAKNEILIRTLNTALVCFSGAGLPGKAV